MCSLLKTIFILFLVNFAEASRRHYPAVSRKFAAPEPQKVERSPRVSPIEYAFAWENAATIKYRNPNIWRFDSNNKIILSKEYKKDAPISYEVIKDVYGPRRGQPKARQNPAGSSWGYGPNAQILMNLIEIAIIGYVSDDKGHPVCWSPSKIHYDFMAPEADNDTEKWCDYIQSNLKHGYFGHCHLFDEMGVQISKRRGSRTELLTSHITCVDYVVNFVPHVPPVIDGTKNVVADEADEVKTETDNSKDSDSDCDDSESGWTRVDSTSKGKRSNSIVDGSSGRTSVASIEDSDKFNKGKRSKLIL